MAFFIFPDESNVKGTKRFSFVGGQVGNLPLHSAILGLISDGSLRRSESRHRYTER